MIKFKVGDKVRVKSLDWVKTESNKHAYYLTYDMLLFCGKVVTIQKIVKNIFSESYVIEEETNKQHWLDKQQWFDYMFEDEVVKEDNDIIKSFEIMEDKDNVKSFKTIADELCALYERKNNAYGNSFGDTYQKLGLISAVTRISDKYNRLCNLATNPNIDNLGESIEDTLKDLAAYSIMTLMEIRKKEIVRCNDI